MCKFYDDLLHSFHVDTVSCSTVSADRFWFDVIVFKFTNNKYF